MVRRVAVAWALVARRGGRARALSPVLQGHPRRRVTAHPNTVVVDRRRRGIRPATTTFFGDTGLWFVPTGEVLAARQVVGQRLSSRHELHPGLHQRRRLRRHVRLSASRTAPRSSDRSCSTRASTATCGRSSSTIRPSAASSIAIRASTGAGPATTSATSISAPRSTLVGVRAEAGGHRGARHDQAADRRQGRRRGTGKPISRSTSSSARKRRSASKCRASPATSSAASRTASTSRPARSAGAPASASRRAAGCG